VCGHAMTTFYVCHDNGRVYVRWASAVMLHIPMTPSFHCTALHCTALHATAIPCLLWRCVWPCHDHFLCASPVQWGLRQVGKRHAHTTRHAFHCTVMHYMPRPYHVFCVAACGHAIATLCVAPAAAFCVLRLNSGMYVTCVGMSAHTPSQNTLPGSDDLTTPLFSVYMWPVRIVTFCVAVLLSVCYVCMGLRHRCIRFYVPSSIAFIPLR
jgi:hypothetical protein